MPNVIVRFQKVVGWMSTILFCLVLMGMLASATISIIVSRGSDWPIWFLPGLVLGALLRPLLLIKPSVTHQALRGIWVAVVLFIVVKRALGSPTWSFIVLAIAGGAYMAASFVFYSSTVMYVASLLEKQSRLNDSE